MYMVKKTIVQERSIHRKALVQAAFREDESSKVLPGTEGSSLQLQERRRALALTTVRIQTEKLGSEQGRWGAAVGS